MWFKERFIVEESADNFVEATNKCMEAVRKTCTLDMFMDMDGKEFEMMRTSIRLIEAYKELALQQAKAIDQLSAMIRGMDITINNIEEKLDKLDKEKSRSNK